MKCSSILIPLSLSIIVLMSPSSAAAQDFMTQEELLATIPGSTLYGTSSQDGKTRWAQTYGKGKKRGKIAGLWGEDKYSAKWSIKGDMWCKDWGDGSGCWRVQRVSEKELQAYKDGTAKVKNPWFIK